MVPSRREGEGPEETEDIQRQEARKRQEEEVEMRGKNNKGGFQEGQSCSVIPRIAGLDMAQHLTQKTTEFLLWNK